MFHTGYIPYVLLILLFLLHSKWVGYCLFAFVLFSICIAGATQNSDTPSSVDLPRFFEVVANKIYRGAQPTDVGISELAHMGVRTILDLRDEDPNQIAAEGQYVKVKGMNFISVPLSGFFEPSEENMNKIQSVLNDKSLQPVFIHCQHGQDRTGLSVGLYRVKTEKVSAKLAEKEMLSHGFHKQLLGLYFYFKEETHGF